MIRLVPCKYQYLRRQVEGEGHLGPLSHFYGIAMYFPPYYLKNYSVAVGLTILPGT